MLFRSSNVASDLIQESAERDIPNIKGRLMDALRKTFRPEFLNRIDEIVTFGALGEDQIRRIVEIQFKDLKKRVAEKKIEITLSPEAATLLAHVGYDPVFGARPLKRAIQRMVENPSRSSDPRRSLPRRRQADHRAHQRRRPRLPAG